MNRCGKYTLTIYQWIKGNSSESFFSPHPDRKTGDRILFPVFFIALRHPKSIRITTNSNRFRHFRKFSYLCGPDTIHYGDRSEKKHAARDIAYSTVLMCGLLHSRNRICQKTVFQSAYRGHHPGYDIRKLPQEQSA